VPYKRKDRWMGCVKRTIEGVRYKKEKVFREKKVATAWEVNMRKLTDKEFLSQKTPSSYSLIDWANDYIAFSQKFTDKTLDEKKSVFKRFFKMFDCSISAKDFNPRMALDYLSEQFKLRSGNASNKDRKNLIAAWNYGKKFIDGFPNVNPFQMVERFPEVRKPRYVPPEEDFWAVYNVSEGQDKLMLLTFLYTAARKREVFRLNVNLDLDFSEGKLRYLTRKTRDGSWKERFVPMLDDLYDAMLSHVQNLKSEFIFTDLSTGLPFKNRQHWLRRQCERGGVRPFDWHSIRHLTSRILARKGVPTKVIQEILGHEHISTTEKYLGTLGVDKKHLQVLSNRKVRQTVRLTDKQKSGEIKLIAKSTS